MARVKALDLVLEILVETSAALLFVLFTAYLIWNLLHPAKAHAEELMPRIRVAVTLVRGENALTRAEARQAMREVRTIFAAELGINLTLMNTRIVSAPHALQRSTLNDALDNDTLYLWNKRFMRPQYSMGGVIDIAILPTIKDDGHHLFAGRSGGLCSLYNGFLITYIGEWRDNGESGLKYSRYTLAHELGHILGATHVDTPTIMNAGPFLGVDEFGEINYDPESVAQIHDCLKDWGKL